MQQNNHESGKIAKRYVIEKLEERNYRVEKNGTVLTVKSPNGTYFTVKVTSLSRPNAWIVPDQENQNAYFVLVFKPEGEPPAFFVLNQNEMQKEKQLHQDSNRRPVSEYSNPELEKKD
jgi:hypothetical protein